MLMLTTQEIKDLKDWYFVTTNQIRKYGGNGLLKYYNGSLIKALRILYPEGDLQEYRFSTPHHRPQGKAMFGKVQYLLFQQVQAVPYSALLINASCCLHTR